MTQSPLERLAFEERTRREILTRSELIPPLPDVVTKLLTLLKDGKTEPKDLEQHLYCDPVLVAKMLALVNSPFYGVAHQIVTIKDAVMVLGFRGLRSLLLTSGTAKFLQRDYGCYGHEPKGLWKHSLAVATCCKALAKATQQHPEAVEEMFVVGLLHDIGKMLLAPYLQERKVVAGPGRDIAEIERKVLGIDHGEAGELVATKWDLSPVVRNALRHHHDPVEQPTDAVCIVRIADRLVHQLGVGYPDESGAATGAVESEMLQHLGIDSGQWEVTRNAMEGEVRAALAQMDGLSS